MNERHLCYVESVIDSGTEAGSGSATRSIRFLRVPTDYENPEEYHKIGTCFHWHYTNGDYIDRDWSWMPREGQYYWLSQSEARWRKNPPPPARPESDAVVWSYFFGWNSSFLETLPSEEVLSIQDSAGGEPTERHRPSELRLIFLQVGFGDSTIIKCGKTSMVVDGNGRSVVAWQRQGFGKTSPFTKALITHAHRDHVCGIIHGIRRSMFGQLIIGKNWGSSPHLTYVQDACKAVGFRGLAKLKSSAGTRSLGSGASLLYAYPAQLIGTNSGSINASSIQLAIEVGDAVVWLAGDAEPVAGKPAEASAHWLASKVGANPSARITKIAHHGSENGLSVSAAFGRNLSGTQFRIVSTGGELYKRKLPSQIIAAQGHRMFRTDHCGDITFVLTNSGGRTSVSWDATTCKSGLCTASSWCGSSGATPARGKCPSQKLCDVQCWGNGRC